MPLIRRFFQESVFFCVFAAFSVRLQTLGKHQTFPAPQKNLTRKQRENGVRGPDIKTLVGAELPRATGS